MPSGSEWGRQTSRVQERAVRGREDRDGEPEKIGKEAERRGRDTEPDRKERKKQSRLDQDFGATILNLASQIDLPKLLELL